jgi:integrase
VLGPVGKMTKAQAQVAPAAIVAPINEAANSGADREMAFREFVEAVFLPCYRRRGKAPTAITNIDRTRRRLELALADRTLRSFTRDQLQTLLDEKCAEGLSFSMVAHLRWDLHQLFKLAQAEGYVDRKPATVLHTPREATSAPKPIMSPQEVKKLLDCVDLRERLIAKLAVLGGMRPGEIFALQWQDVGEAQVEVKRRVYKGDIDTPKTRTSQRTVALPESVVRDIAQWRDLCPSIEPDAWLFPSERLTTPFSRENCWQRNLGPRLKANGLGRVNFRVMRRTHLSLMRELEVDPKVTADQLGHSVEVNQNVYTQAYLIRRLEAVRQLESACLTADSA